MESPEEVDATCDKETPEVSDSDGCASCALIIGIIIGLVAFIGFLLGLFIRTVSWIGGW
jgi:hypothetical protein